jgi:Fur family ferric uptake transcriptional regulator
MLNLDKVQIKRYTLRMRRDPTQTLRDHQVHVTAQRLAVLRAVSAHPHCTADEVAEQVRGEIGAISRQAVYDALSMLSEKGILRRIQPAGSAARYEDRVGDNHHHLVCRSCGKTVDVDCAVGDAPCLTASHDAGYRIEEAEVVYWGTCPACLAAAGESGVTHAPRHAGHHHDKPMRRHGDA